MSKKQYSTRLSPDRAEELERYCEKTGVAKSEVIRRSVEDHLDDEDRDGTEPIWYWVMAIGIALVLVNQITIPLVYSVGSFLFYLGLIGFALLK